jgi:glycosyltransferase involved in cell wall biosynthesis
MTKSRVLILENSIAITGALVSITRSCNDLKANFDFFFILPKGSSAIDYVKKAGFPVYEFPLVEIRRDWSIILYLPYLLANTVRLRMLVRLLKIDLINVNDFYNLMPGCYRFFGGKIPYVCYVRFLPSKFPRVLVKVWSLIHHKFARTLICVSNIVRTELPYKKKAIVIGNELPENTVRYEPSPSKVILYPANYIKGKGQEYALESFALIHSKYPEWKLRFVGGDMGLKKNQDFKESLRIESRRLGLENQVELFGFSEDLEVHYKSAAFVLNFSESESFSLTCLEALYYGRPVIATKCGGPQEIISGGITGLLVELRNVQDMAGAIEYLICRPEERQLMGERGYLDVRHRYSFEHTGQKLIDTYNVALSK